MDPNVYTRGDLQNGALDDRYYTEAEADAAAALAALLAGRAGGQTINGGTGAGDDLTLQSTSNATKGDVLINTGGGNVGIANASPSYPLHVTGRAQFTSVGNTWTAPTYNTGWGNVGGYQNAQYKIVGDLVFLRGSCVRSSGTETTIFTLPSGYRPPALTNYSVTTDTGVGEIEITVSGAVTTVAGGTGYISLDGIVLSVDS